METGFPSPAQGYEEKTIDLNTLLVKHPAATVFMQIDTDRYRSIGIYNGDLLIVDRSLKVHTGDYVVFESEGEFKLGRTDLLQRAIDCGTEVIICGVITNVIHTVKNKIIMNQKKRT